MATAIRAIPTLYGETAKTFESEAMLTHGVSFSYRRCAEPSRQLHYYEKNGFRYLIADERLEAKYMGIGVGRLPLNTRLMYFDLLKLKVNS